MGDKVDQLDIILKERTPFEGQQFESEVEAYNFYNMYAAHLGFTIRREYVNKDKSGLITSRKFTCTKEGYRRKDKRDHLTKRPRPETKTGCQAMLSIWLVRETKKYKVTQFVAEHNHPLIIPLCALVSSEQRITQDELASSGLLLKQSHELVGKQDGGKENLTYEDFKRCLPNRRKRSFKYGEAGSLLRYFEQQHLENSSIYYAVQLDSEEKITNLFWADSTMIIDYADFGEVVTFDTRYIRKKENRPLGVFVGLNHHQQLVIFGAALLYDDTVYSFQWLFETFLGAMSGRPPKTFFTDEDPAIAAALAVVMPNTYHGFCTYHIRQNFNNHLGHLMKAETGLEKMFSMCMFEIQNEEALEVAWREMLHRYDLESNKWLKSIFELKEKWAKAYLKTNLTLGMRSEQFSKSFNSELKSHLKSDQDLVQFLTHFSAVIKGRRHQEFIAEYHSRQNSPALRLKSSPMLNQLSKVYTPAIFEVFQNEFDESLALVVKCQNINDDVHEYKLARYDGGDDRTVIFEKSTKSISCSCQKYDCERILCSHALKVFDVLNIKLIPDKYIEKRWTREARKQIVQDTTGENSKDGPQSTVARHHRLLCSALLRIAARAAVCEEATDLVSHFADDLARRVEEICNMQIPKLSTKQSALAYAATEADGAENIQDVSEGGTTLGIKERQMQNFNERPQSWIDKLGEKRKYPKDDSMQVETADKSSCPGVVAVHISDSQSPNGSLSLRSSQSDSGSSHWNQATTCPSQDSSNNPIIGQSSLEVVQYENNAIVGEKRNISENFNGLSAKTWCSCTGFLMSAFGGADPHWSTPSKPSCQIPSDYLVLQPPLGGNLPANKD